jgi:hypothetical protein
MIIDIGAHLRRLVLTGLPLLGVGCNLPGGEPPLPQPLAAACEPKMVVEGPTFNTRTIAIGFDRADPRLSDLYEACVGSGDYCLRLCQEILMESRGLLPRDQQQILTPPNRCELACDRSGQAVATVSFTPFTGAIGRRPEGFREVASAAPGTSLADFFAGCAALEGASISAFAILAPRRRSPPGPGPRPARRPATSSSPPGWPAASGPRAYAARA